MITSVILNKEQGKTFASFFISEEQAKENLKNLTKVRSKELFTFNDFLSFKGITFDFRGKKYKSVKGLLKAELEFVKNNYPRDLRHYSNVLNLFK
jgi:hypothetical protein